MDFAQIHLHVGGEFFGRILLLPTTIYIALYTGLSMRVFAQALKMFLLDTTPIYAIVLFMTLVAAYSVYNGIYAIGGIIDIIFPICITTIAGIVLLSFQQVDVSYIKPILFENTDNVIKGIIPGFQQFTGYGLVAYFLRYTQKAKGTFKWYIAGVGIPVASHIVLTLVCIMVFTAPGIVSLIYPTLTLIKSIEFPVTFLERLESLAAILWIGIVFMSIILFFFASVRNFAVLLGIQDRHQKYVIWGHIPLLAVIALAVKSGIKVLEYIGKVKYLQTSIGFIVLPILIGLVFLKKRKEGGK
jgi:spore germination protein